MGYTTTFTGAFTLAQPLSAAQCAYLRAFSETRRVKRNAEVTRKLPDPRRAAVGLAVVGREGGYYVGGPDYAGEGILDENHPPAGQPGLWCQWVPSEDGLRIEWDGGEKFYHYVAWLKYLIEHFLKPWGHVLNGEVEWAGEDPSDRGKIVVKNNAVTTLRATIRYE